MTRTCACAPTPPGDLVRWGPVAAAAVIAVTVFATLDSMWMALAYGGGNTWLVGTLPLFLGCSAAVALFVAGLLSGLFSGHRNEGSGAANGAAAWGLTVILSLVTVVPATVELTSRWSRPVNGSVTVPGAVSGSAGGFTVETTLWTGFCAVLTGLVIAVLGGVVGDAMRRPVAMSDVVRLGEEHMCSADIEQQPYGDPRLLAVAPVGPRTLRVAGRRRGVTGMSGDDPTHPAA